MELWDEEGEEDEETEEVGSATDVGETVKDAEAEEDSDELEEMDVAESAGSIDRGRRSGFLDQEVRACNRRVGGCFRFLLPEAFDVGRTTLL